MLSRRIVLAGGAALAAGALGGSRLAAPSLAVQDPARTSSEAYPFSLGVASGAPLPDSVMLWTRILSDPLNSRSSPALAVRVRWQVAHDEGFRHLAAQGSASATPQLAHSVHVDVRGLEPDRWYWYRFMLGDAVSPVGRTRTAPAPGSLPASLKLVAASCQHWEFGSYAAHAHIAQAAPDLVAFLGDYIYEWGPYALRHPARATRSHESFTLDQDRARYAQYKSDPQLQAAHHAAPWIVTWDDHEVANDYTPDRDERLDPRFALRRAAAYQAFYEHMPLRGGPVADFGQLRIHQRHDWGRLARFHVLDDRQFRSVQACSPATRGGSSSVTRACAALRDAGRTMLGSEQERWLEQGLRGARAHWNLLLQQTPMAQSSQVPLKSPRDGRFWNDGWDGYPVARERLLEALQASGAKGPLVLAGDVHTFYASELVRDFARKASASNPVIASEFCGTSVTSSSRPQARTEQLVANNRHTHYGRSDKRGFMLLTVTPDETLADFVGLDNVADPASAARSLARFRVSASQPGVVRA